MLSHFCSKRSLLLAGYHNSIVFGLQISVLTRLENAIYELALFMMRSAGVLRLVCSRRTLYRAYATVLILTRLFIRLISWVLEVRGVFTEQPCKLQDLISAMLCRSLSRGSSG